MSRGQIKTLVLKHAKHTRQQVSILDVGCGAATALNQLLSYKSLHHSLQLCTGISKSYFSRIQQVLIKHGARFEYQYGLAQDILPHLTGTQDLIFDVYGACTYSVDKLRLLQLYYQCLKPGGVAHVSILDKKAKRSWITVGQQPAQTLVQYLCSQYPTIFTLRATHGHCTIVTMSKNKVNDASTLAFGAMRYQLCSFQQGLSTPSRQPMWLLHRANAVAAVNVKYRLI